MNYKTTTLYSKNANGKVILWKGEVSEYGNLIITTGQINGKLRDIVNSNVKPKGKLNKFEQAVKELKAKFKLKLDKGYKRLSDLGYESIDIDDDKLYKILDSKLSVNKTDSNNILKPMKAKTFVKGKCKYPMLCQPKINGFRTSALLIKDIAEAGNMFATGESKVKLLTKEGHEYVVPNISNNIFKLSKISDFNFDGELYVHNEILSNINRRIPKRKKDSNTVSNNSLPIDPLTFCVFDLNMSDINQLERLDNKNAILMECGQIYYNSVSNLYYIVKSRDVNYSNIINVNATIIYSDDEALKHRDAAIASGFEGVVLRNLDAEYMFGGRRNNMVKYKQVKHSEFKVLAVILKNEDSVRTYVGFKLQNDTNDLTFEVTALGSESDRQDYINNPDKYIGKTITLGFGERTVRDLPLHIKEMAFRNEYDLSEDDLNIEI